MIKIEMTMKTNFNIQKEIISHLKSSARVYQGYSKGIRFVATILVLLFIGVGQVCGATGAITVASEIIIPAGSITNITKSYWSSAGAPAYSTSNDVVKDITISSTKVGSIRFYHAGYDSDPSKWCALQASNGYLETVISSTYGVDVEVYCKRGGERSGNVSVSLTGGTTQTMTGTTFKTLKISTSSTSATLKISNGANNQGIVGYIKITPKAGSSKTFDLKVPVGNGTYSTLSGKDKSWLTQEKALSAVSCGGGTLAGYYANKWTSSEISTPTSTYPSPVYTSSTADGSLPASGTKLYPVFTNSSGLYLTNPRCATYTLYYDANGGTGAPSDQAGYAYNASVTVNSSVTPTRSGYTFLGWATSSTATSKNDAYDPGDVFNITDDIILYAVWCRDLSDASDFSLNTSSLSSTGVTISWSAVTGATKYDLRLYDENLDLINTYSNLASTSKSLTGLTAGTEYNAEVLAKNDCNDTDKASSLLDFTTKHVYTITYYKNDGSGTSETESKTEGVNYTISSNKFSRDGYTLTKWNTQTGGGGTDYTKGATYSTDAPLDLYAVWTAQNYTITLNGNGGSGNPANVSATYGSAAPSVGTLPTKADKNFAGYWTGEGGTGTMVVDASGVWVAGISGYTDGSKNWIGTEGKTIYAKWVDKTYTNYRTTCSETYDIVLHDNNGGSHNGSAKVADGGKLLTNIVAPTRDGYSVEGYYAEAGTSTKIADASGVLQSDKTGYTDAGGAWTKGDDATLYAKWTATNYTITYDGLEGASNSNPTSYTIATPTITLVAPGSREGYTFAGWTCGGTPIMQIAVGSTGDKTITATWTANTYTVQFNANGGGGSMSPQNFTYGVAQSLTSNGFTVPSEKSFGGWTTNSDGTGDFYTNGQEVSNLTSVNGATVDLYAKWVDCDLYTVTLNVNGDTWKTIEQSSCGASIDLSGYQDVPSCGGGYTLVGWSTTNSADPMFDAPAITKTSSYTPESDVTLYAVYSHTAVIGTRIMNTGSISVYDSYIVVASAHNKVMCVPPSTTNLAAATDVVKSADGSKCYVTGNGTPFEIMFSDKSTYWMISKYNSSTGNNWYYYSQSSRNALAWYDEDDYAEWWIYNYIEKYGDWYDAEDYVASSTASSKWSISIDGSGNATISEATNNRIWKYNSTDVKFGAYNSGSYKAVSLYRYDEGGSIYTTQPSMTVYTISKGAETNGTYTISAGVVCSGQAVAVTATPASGYAFGGWESDNGGTFVDASAASTTFTPTANTTVTANFVLRESHNITWMVNGAAYTTGTPTGQLYGGDSFGTMTLPTAPADNTLSNACGAVANQFVGWSTTNMGFATGQSAPAKLFTTAAGAGTAYGTMGGEDVVFYAVFAQDGSSNYMSRCADTYSITLDKKEGTTDGTATATEMGSTLDITLAPTYAGHSVEGYYAETGRTTKIANANGSLIANKSGYTDGSGKWINTTSPLTLYTKWTLNSHILTWNLDGGSISAAGTPAGTVAYGTELVAPTVTRTGYTFNAWSPAVDATMPDNDVTYTATWTAKQYAITYKDKDDAAYSGDKTDGRPTGCPANHTYGSATDLPYGVKAGYRFDGWFTTSACTGDPITSIASDEEGPFTLYAKWTASHTFTFSKNGVVDGTLTLGQVEGGNVIMPNTTVDCGLWTTFEGWVIGDVAETTTEPTTIYKPGDIFVAGNSNQEFKAVYSKHEGDASVYYEKVTSGPKSGTYVMVSYPRNDIYYIYTSYNASSYCNQSPVTISDNGTVSAANATSASAREVTVRAGNGANTGKFAIYDGTASKYLTGGAGSVGVNNDITFCWNLMDGSTKVNSKEQIPKAGAIHSTTNTTYLLQLRNHSTCDRFQMYANTQTDGTNPYDVYLYRKRVAGTTYYTTAPGSCEVPTKITVSYNDNKANAGDQTISGMPSGTTIDFTTYPDFASYTIGAAPTDPTGYHFAGWNTSADGSGDAYTAGASVTTFGYTETITLYAQWERVYTVTLMDNGVERTRLTQASAGANVTLPSGNNCGVGSAFTFVGWTDSPVQLNAEPVRPNIVSGAGEWGDDELTDDITLYSVYSRSVASCDDFAAGVSGAYTMQDRATGNYAVVTANANRYDKNASSATAEKFYISYSAAKSAYTIRTSLGYLGWSGGAGSENLTKNNTTPYYWTIREGTGAAAGYWQFKPMGVSGKQFSGANTNFNIHSDGTAAFIQLTKTAMTYYFNTAICEGASVIFHDGGEISGAPNTPGSSTWNSTTHVLSGLEDCDKITTFPTASYDGWQFVGWSTEDYTNSGKHTAGTSQYAAENASTDEPDGSILFKTGGNSYTVRGGSIDLYPVFTRFPDNEPFDLETGGTYYMYYLDASSDDGYGAPQRKYAAAHDGTKRYSATTNCADATAFIFTKEGDVWHIQNAENDKYLGGKASDDWLIENAALGTLTDWTITIRSGNQFNASCQSGRQIIVFENFFMDYASSNLTSGSGYKCVYLGSCEERIFSSEPYPKPTIDLTGEPMVTSSAGQTVRATTPLTLSGSHLAGATKITLTGTNLKFATSATTAPVASLEVAVSSGNVAATDVYVYYTPTETEDGIENVIITATDNGTAPAETKAAVQVRHLPADFVIAAMIGDKWYALPADINSSSANTTGVLIEVDNVGDPTAATAAPMNTKWGLRNVKTTRQTTNGLGDYLTFTERETATADNQKTLYNGSGTSIQTSAQWSNYAATNPEKYEWIPTTADFKDYTLTSAAETRTLSLNTSGVFGSLTQSKAYDGKVRLLPASFYEPAEMQVVEWKASSVVVLYTGSGTTATTKVGTGSESSAQTLTAKKIDHGVFELTTGTLTGNANKVLTVTIKNGSSVEVGKTMLTIPAIVNGTSTAPMDIAAAATPATDVVVLDGGTLSAAATKYTFKNITVYPGGKLVIGSGKQLGMASLTLRGGSAWGAATYEHKYPQFVVNNATDGAYTNSSAVINYDYVTTKDQYYSFVLPYGSNTKNVKYPIEIYGRALESGSQGSFEFQYYDGAARAAGEDGWKVLEEDPSTGADLVAGKGYTFLGMPRKIDAYDGTDNTHANTRQRYGIHRIPMSVAAGAVQTGETTDKNITISVALAAKNNNSGWNLVGNPYMAEVSGLSNTDIQVGKLVHTSTVPWDGRWQWDPESQTASQRFVVIPSNDGQTYESSQATTAVLPAFKNFFVQISNGEATTISFAASGRNDKNLLSALFKDEPEQDIQLAVDLVSDTRSDKVDLLINDAYSAGFDEDADFTKMMNSTNLNLYGVYPGDNLSFIAIDKTTASNSIAIGYQVPSGGDYTLRLSDRDYVMRDYVDALLVTDHEVEPEVTTNLLTSPYVFHVNNAETNDTRFTLAIILSPQTPTDIEVIEEECSKIDTTGAVKFLYHDKVYILYNGVVYDSTGKRVTEINK